MYAYVLDNQVQKFADSGFGYLFPEISFRVGMTDEELQSEMSIYKATFDRPFDATSQKLTNCDPYFENGSVYAVRVDNMTLLEQKIAKAEVVAAKYASITSSGRNYNGKNYQIDDVSCQVMLTVKVQIQSNAPNAWNGFWVSTDNSINVMTSDQAVTFFNDVYSYVQAAKVNYFTLRGAVNGASDTDTLAAIDIKSGWPAN